WVVAGTALRGGRGGPCLPQPARTPAVRSITRTPGLESLENIAGEILILNDAREHPAHVLAIDLHFLARHVGSLEGDLVEQPLHERREPPGADVLGRGVDLDGEAGDLADRIGGELER